MLFVKADVRDSPIFGKGLFAAERVPRGTVVCFFSQSGTVITEAEFVEAVEAGVKSIIRTGTRYFGKYFVHCDGDAPWNYVNHSFEPVMLVHCGVCVAKREVAAGEELTVDYRTLIDPTDVGIWPNAGTKREIRGFTAKETLLRTARELIALVEDIDGWEG